MEHDVIITDSVSDRRYVTPQQKYKGAISEIDVGNEKVIGLNLFGWKLGWLGTYIIFSIAFSLTLRKLLGLH